MILQTVLFFVLLRISSISANIKRIETASRAIAQVIDMCSEKFSVRFKLVIVGNDSDLFKIAGKVSSISNSSLTVQTIPVKFNKNYDFFSDSVSQIFLFNDDYSINEPKHYTYEVFFRSVVLIDFSYPKNYGEDSRFSENSMAL